MLTKQFNHLTHQINLCNQLLVRSFHSFKIRQFRKFLKLHDNQYLDNHTKSIKQRTYPVYYNKHTFTRTVQHTLIQTKGSHALHQAQFQLQDF